MTTLETNVDDLNPQIFSYVIDRLLRKGAQAEKIPLKLIFEEANKRI